MAIDDPSLLVNILGRDLRVVTKERDDLLQKVKELESRPMSPSQPDPRIQELESANASLLYQVLELETELRGLRETAFSRLTESVEMRNRRAGLKRELRQAQAKLKELENSQEQAAAQMDEKARDYEGELMVKATELASERKKNKGLKDLVVKVTEQRDHALLKLAGIRKMSTIDPAVGGMVRSSIKPAHRLNTETTVVGLTDAPSIDNIIPDLQFRSRRLNSLNKLPRIATPPEAVCPICGLQENLDEKLRVLGKAKIFNPPFFIGECDVEFANPSRQHGYTLRPTHVVVTSPSVSNQQWEPYSIEKLEPEFPSIFELFIGSLKGWSYKGTYRRIGSGGARDGEVDLPNLTVGEYVDLPRMTKTRLLEQALRQSPISDSSSGQPPSASPDDADPFASGHVPISCVGLQCVGFNSELYRALLTLQLTTNSDAVPPEFDIMDTGSYSCPEERSSWSDDASDTPGGRARGHKRLRSRGSFQIRKMARIGEATEGTDKVLAKSVKHVPGASEVKFADRCC
ncbi:hypothetical protein FRB96_002941 [Tulasnella sp. 330]|nr:hypothetical protein FRB96_002941 [Tulasnella sp. 330]